MKFYAIKTGLKTGIFNDWNEAKTYVQSFNGAKYKSFTDLKSATDYLKYDDDHTVDNMNPHYLYIFTDGSYQKNINKHSFGVYIPQLDYKYSYTFIDSTNNRNELSAIKHGLLYLDSITIEQFYDKVIIVSDSDYCIKSLTIFYKKWFDSSFNIIDESKKNLDLIKDILILIKQSKYKIEFLKVKSHTHNIDSISKNNNIVDKIAKD